MNTLNHTHDPAARSWLASANGHADFPLQNLPYAVFTQRGAIAALQGGESFIADQVARMTASRDALCDGLAATGRVRFARPGGAFYLFCAIEGEPDTRKLALRLVDEANVGLAPGSAFGTGGEDYLRICFARSPAQMTETAKRLADWLKRA